jgi:excisionase family DNA binding protein
VEEVPVDGSRAERFAALDEQLESALKAAAGRSSTKLVVGDADPVELPAESLKALHKLVHGLAASTEPMLTTTEAADFLGVSRPYLTRLLKAGKLPYRKKGNRHLVPASAVRDFKDRRDRRLDELAALAQAEEDLGVR